MMGDYNIVQSTPLTPEQMNAMGEAMQKCLAQNHGYASASLPK